MSSKGKWRFAGASVALLACSSPSGSVGVIGPVDGVGGGSTVDDGRSGGEGGAIQSTGGSAGPDGGQSMSSSAEGEYELRYPCADQCPDDVGARPVPLPRPICPSVEPGEGEPCEIASALACGYGDSPMVGCRTYFECDEVWQEPTWTERLPCPTDFDCPEAKPVSGSVCPGEELPYTCSYAQAVRCSCRSISLGGPTYWGCQGPPVDVRCPAQLPNLGEGCAENGLNCYYVSSGCGAAPSSSVRCFQGAWQPGEAVPCAR